MTASSSTTTATEPCDCGWIFADQAEADNGCPACRTGVDTDEDEGC